MRSYFCDPGKGQETKNSFKMYEKFIINFNFTKFLIKYCMNKIG